MDGKFVRMYQDWSAGRITGYIFNLLTKKEEYQAEQLELEEKISRLQAEAVRRAANLPWMPKKVGRSHQAVRQSHRTDR